jgi:hypothetical protein
MRSGGPRASAKLSFWIVWNDRETPLFSTGSGEEKVDLERNFAV